MVTVSRPQQSARPWVLRGLLVLVFLAGLGLWQGAHCPEPAAAGAGTHSSTSTSTSTAESDECGIARVTAVSTVAGARLPLPSVARGSSAAPPPQSVRTRLVPAVALATIGVCRT